MNPFVFDKPLEPAELVDREDELAQLVSLWEGGHNSLLSAARRFGKTTLLGKLAEQVRDLDMPAVTVDFYGVVSVEGVAVRIEEAYREGLQGPVAQAYASIKRTWRPRLRLGPPGAILDAGPLPSADADRLLYELLDLPVALHKRTGKRTLVVFDEFQDLLSADPKVDGLLRSRIQLQRNEASYVFAGSHPGLMAELFGDRARPLFGQARPVRLGPLPDRGLEDYIAGRFSATGREAGMAIDPLLVTVRGHPQRAMLLAHHLWNATPARTTATEETFSEALEIALRELDAEFRGTWDGLSVNQRRVTAAVAWIGEWGQGDTLFSNDTLNRFKLKRGTVRDVRKQLLTAGLLELDKAEQVRLVDPLLETWIASGRRPRY
jgi:AAA+ ATPase superfamily predicted ATPase